MFGLKGRHFCPITFLFLSPAPFSGHLWLPKRAKWLITRTTHYKMNTKLLSFNAQTDEKKSVTKMSRINPQRSIIVPKVMAICLIVERFQYDSKWLSANNLKISLSTMKMQHRITKLHSCSPVTSCFSLWSFKYCNLFFNSFRWTSCFVVVKDFGHQPVVLLSALTHTPMTDHCSVRSFVMQLFSYSALSFHL